MKKAFLILGAVVLAFTALVGIAFGANQALEKTTTTTHAVSQPVRAIEVDIDVGDVELIRGNATVEVRESLEYALNKPTVDQTIEDGVLTLKSDCSGRGSSTATRTSASRCLPASTCRSTPTSALSRRSRSTQVTCA